MTPPWEKAPQQRKKQLADTDLLYGDATFDGSAADPREAEQGSQIQIKADQAHQVTDGSRDIRVRVLDSGIDPIHPDLQSNIDVAGIIGAARNGVGTVGIAPNVRMASGKVVNDAG